MSETRPPGIDADDGSDEAALAILRERQREMLPQLKRPDCPPETIGHYMVLCGTIMALEKKLTTRA